MNWIGVVYLLSGSVLSAAGGAVVLMALWGDRFGRGHTRRRCTKCWFDLSATPGLTCPECGKTAKEESRLFRTRRRWWFATLGALVVAAGAVMGGWPSLKRDGFGLLPMWLKVELWVYASDPNAAFTEVVSAATTHERQKRVMDTAMWWLLRNNTSANPALAAMTPGATPAMVRAAMMQSGTHPSVVLSYSFAQWPLSDSGRDDLLKLIKQPELGYQGMAVEAVLYRTDIDERFYQPLCTVALEGQAREPALRALHRFVPDHAWARDTVAKALRESVMANELYSAAAALLNDGHKHAGLLKETFAKTTSEGRQALMSAAPASKEVDVRALYPQILEEAVTGDTRAMKTAFGVLASAGASVDDLVAARVTETRGEAFMRLIDLVNTRRVRSGEVLAMALEAAADDGERPAAEREAAKAAAEKVRKRFPRP